MSIITTPVHVTNPFEHPDALRRFHVVDKQSELQKALDWPWEKWTTFLHPRQRKAVEGQYNGPGYVSGGAGTGKTVVALHRAHRLLQADPESRLLFTTFSSTLATRLEHSINILMGADSEERRRVEITNLHALARRIFVDERGGRFSALDRKELHGWMDEAREATAHQGWTTAFLVAEWEAIVDADGKRFDAWLKSHPSREYVATPIGRRLKGDVPTDINELIDTLLAACSPLGNAYPMPHFLRSP
ncbi:MAG: UvrD-helicase domain-containing protein [Bradymonadaceae bacterium]